MTLTPVPPGQLATIVTSLEMTTAPRPRPLPPAPFRLVRWPAPQPDRYRALFRRIGTRWLWFSRLAMDDAAVLAIVGDPAVEVFAMVDRQGIEIGMLELDFREAGTCTLAYVGLIPELAGKGHGGWLMAQALGLGWRKGITRLQVNTCTLDHPAALPFYLKSGFRAVARTVETFVDPRLAGLLPREAAPQIPLFEPVLAGPATS
ncbi:GNAT family N-acetyltransferase [Sphingomonas solaris]|uniref:GNAT family N-acetyltransferase n=1 Tax=Alterirhizorhabdus solaris TaxID=2529389 RepID=A0A558R6U5_9SPHN|nr:GNAT family N-acetyltransferase [Sphingomonas solaris]TVV75042.1 GNAT family N-acetyltransferase [Sphingomonas solaris]